MATPVDIIVRGGLAYVEMDDPELWEALREATSFTIEGAQYRQRGTNRPTRLIRNTRCPLGLLDRVCRVLTAYGAQPRVVYEDALWPKKPRLYMDLVDVKPRDYQLESKLAAQLSKRGVFRAPTGSGKSCMILLTTATIGYHTLIIEPTIDLPRQVRDYAKEHLVAHINASNGTTRWEIGQLGDGVINPQPVTVTTIRTIAKLLDVAYSTYEYAEYDDADDTQISAEERKELRKWIESIGTVQVDEAHQLGAKVLYDTVTKIPAVNKYGWSASPWRDDGADLMIEAATGPPIFYVSTSRLVKHGWLMAPEIHVIDTSKWWTSAAWGSYCANCGRQWLKWTKECDCGCKTFRSQYQESYRKEIAENQIRNGHISRIVQQLNRPTLILVKQVKHGRELAAVIPHAIFLSGQRKGEDRQAAFDAVRVGLQKVIVCTTIADMGLDIPSLGALILAGGGRSSTRHLQRIGRVVRPFKGKTRPIVIDLDDSHIHSWYANHIKRRRAVERAEWGKEAVWVNDSPYQ